MISVNYIGSMYVSNTINGRRELVPADLPGIQYIYTYNIHTDDNKCYRVPVGTGSRRERVPAEASGSGFPPAGSGAGSRREPVPADRYAYVYGVLDICQREIAN